MIVCGIHCKFLIVLPILLKTWSFFLFYKGKCARPKNRTRLRNSARPTAPDQHRARDLSRPVIWENTSQKKPVLSHILCSDIDPTGKYLFRINNRDTRRDYSFRTIAKVSEKLTFLILNKQGVRNVNFPEKFCERTKWMILKKGFYEDFL